MRTYEQRFVGGGANLREISMGRTRKKEGAGGKGK